MNEADFIVLISKVIGKSFTVLAEGILLEEAIKSALPKDEPIPPDALNEINQNRANAKINIIEYAFVCKCSRTEMHNIKVFQFIRDLCSDVLSILQTTPETPVDTKDSLLNQERRAFMELMEDMENMEE